MARLFRGYRDWLAAHVEKSPKRHETRSPGLDLIDQSISNLPGVYGPPRGDVLVATKSADLVACGVLREWKPSVGQIERIYVRGDHRGPGFGPKLIRALIDRARELGYGWVRVDAIPSMIAAIEYYQAMGFKPIPAYWEHPVPGTLFFERGVDEGTSRPTAPRGSGSRRARGPTVPSTRKQPRRERRRSASPGAAR